MEAFLTITIGPIVDYVLATHPGVVIAQVFFLVLIFYALKGLFLLSILRVTGRHKKPYSRMTGSDSCILLAGDSTAVGTGASSEKYTLAGYLAHDFPHTDIHTVGVNGALTREVIPQLDSVSEKKYKLIIITIGGNDVWSFTRLTTLRGILTRILQKAKGMSDGKVVLIFFGNEGSAPFFPFFLKHVLMKRTEEVRTIFEEISHIEQVPFIELFSNSQTNPFVFNPKLYFAPDMLHPNDLGYWEWYKNLWRLMMSKGYIYHEEVVGKRGGVTK